MSDEDLKFSSEEERLKALDSFDETKGSQEELDRIMNAKIEPASAEVKPPPSAPDASQPESAKEPATPAPEKPPATETKPPVSLEEWAKSQGYESLDDLKKAHEELKKTSESQKRYLKETIERPVAPPPPVAQAPAPASSAQVAKQENKIATIRQALSANHDKRRVLAEELKLDTGLATDPEFAARRLAVDAEASDLNLKMLDEMDALRSMLDTNAQQLKEYATVSEQQRIREQNALLLQKEMEEIDSFSTNPKHPEFAFTEGKDSHSVEAEYIDWANSVASAMYGSQVDMRRSKQENEAVAHALDLLKSSDPKVTDACRALGIALEPSEDIKKYLDICDLLDHRDGLKHNPVTGQKEQQFRMVRDQQTGMFRRDPVRFASIEDAYQHRLAIDGTYQKKIKDSYVKGTKDMAAAAQKRATAPAEIGNAAGTASTDVGMTMTPQDALKAISEIDEFEAERRRLAGDSSLSDKLEKAMSILGTVTMKN